jgi:hypothetical protein
MSTQVTLNISNIQNNNVPCADPVVLVLGTTGEIAFPCGNNIDKDGNIKLTLPTSEFANNCITVVVKCSECGHCPEQERTICLCSDSNDCPSCETCIEGICQSRCLPDEFCKDNTCVECDENNPCPKGFICINGKCVCLGKINERGECVECLGNGDCSQCESCQDNQCVEKVCPNNLTCISGDCSCPPGTKYDVLTNSCIPVGCENDGQCGECETCVANNCQPISCPEDYKCVGGECIPWGCTNTSCSSGADCGENCGCLNGECVPCYLLECTGDCAEALGCKCNTNTDKCEPVDNCGDYCDGSTPCLDQNCTCYNNTCVSCENFPCIEGDGGCDSYYNCGCTNGDCGGGKGCADKLELTKIENCPTECALEAKYTTESNCGCDPIEFRIKNKKTCNLASGTVLDLEVKAYKNNIAYENYLSELSIGDDELLNATLKTQIKFFTKNASGAWVAETVNPVLVPDISATNNKFGNIEIKAGNLGFTGNITNTNRKAEIVVRVVGLKVPANDCIKYGEKVIASYTLDFSTSQITCNQVETYKAEIKTILTDNESIRRPLFIWSKSNTGTFLPTKYNPSTSYNNSGWFRKEYGERVGNTWTDKINKLADGLWNNLNYKVTVDCGCKSNTTNLEKVVFCCPTEFNYTITNCGRKITVNPFETCEVNKKISEVVPAEVQTYYYLLLNDSEYLLRDTGGNLINDFTIELTDPIYKVGFEQRYIGDAIVPVACGVEYEENPDVPDFDVEVECGKIIIKKKSGTPTISSVLFVNPSFRALFTPTNSNTVWTAEVPKETLSTQVRVQFTGGCAFTKTVDVVCQPIIEAVPTKIVAQGECPNGTNPDVLVKAISGFSSAAEFLNPKDNTWSTGTVVSGVLQKNFTNFAAGTYIFKVREGSKIAEATVTIEAIVKPTIVIKDICGNVAGEIKIAAGKAGSTWRITGPAFLGGTSTQLNTAGESTISIPSDKPGEYFITLLTDTTGFTCPQVLTATVNKDGGAIAPTITTSLDIACQGSEVQFKIADGGENLTYFVTVNGGLLQDLNGNPINKVQASNNGPFNAKVKITNVGSININVTSIDGNVGCYVLTPTSKSITATAGPVIENIFVQCSPNTLGHYWVHVQTSGTVTSVVLNGVAGTLIGGGGTTYLIEDILLYNPATSVVTATNSTTGCTATQILESLPNCDEPDNFCPQPPQIVNIITNPPSPTCGIENVSILFNNSSLGVLDGEQYAWYEVIGNSELLISSGTIDPLTVLPNVQGVLNLVVSSSNQEKTYKLRITTQGVCAFDSESTSVVAGSTITPTITGPITGTMTTGNYNYFVADIPGATYTWTLTNTSGTNQPIGDGTANVTITNFTEGNNTINVSVVSGGCSGSASLLIVVDLDCPQTIIVQPVGGSGSNNCKNLTYTLNNNTSAILSYRWLIDGAVVASGGATVSILDTSTIVAGDTVDVELEITFADGCTVTSAAYEYTKCSCICDTNSSCQTLVAFAGANSTTSYLVPDADIYIKFKVGGYPDRLIVEDGANTTVYLDTYQVGTNTAVGLYRIGTGAPTPYQSFDLDAANADTWQTGIAVGDDIADLRTVTAPLCSDLPVGAGATPNDAAFFPTVLAGVTAIRGNDEAGEKVVLIKIPQSSLVNTTLKVTGVPYQFESCTSGNSGNTASYQISCESFDALLP